MALCPGRQATRSQRGHPDVVPPQDHCPPPPSHITQPCNVLRGQKRLDFYPMKKHTWRNKSNYEVYLQSVEVQVVHMATDGDQGDPRVAEHGLDGLIAALDSITPAAVGPVAGPGDRTHR